MPRKSHWLFAIISGLICVACTPASEKLRYSKSSFAGLSGWEEVRLGPVFGAYLRSCASPKASAHQLKALYDEADAQAVCAKAKQLRSPKEAQLRTFFETYFTPYALKSDRGRTLGLLTGYYIPLEEGSLTRTNRFKYPAYAVPSDLKQPYFSREEIENGALEGKGLELVWFDDKTIPFFIQIQGSGRVRLRDGRIIELQYADKNGHEYTAIGKVLIERDEIPRSEISLQSIKKWLQDHPDQADEVMNMNASYVFFKRAEAESLPLGAQGVPLTPEHSLAIDQNVLPYGLPVYIRTMAQHSEEAYGDFRHVLVTQDRGGAIKGPLRGDIFFGQGKDAEERAGRQKYSGAWVALVPTGARDE
ncbi:MAG: MltA domain-containing protein [Rickettsiales bacterium]|nr:MltA domain-containing protein [Rickettsiales bacterium]